MSDGEKTAILYLRVSTEEQVENFSLDTQEDICKKEAARKGYRVIHIFREEGKSAKSIVGRPVLTEALKFCRKHKGEVHAFIVYRLDRLSRQTADYLAIKKSLLACNVTLISASEPTGTSPTETLLETILASFAQHDNDVRSERTKNGLHARYLSGLLNTKPPLGYVLQDGHAVPDTATWETVKRAWDFMATGTKSLREVAELLNTCGIQSVYGKKTYTVRPQTAQRIFRSKFYAGYLTSNSYPEEVKGQHPPMITLEQYYQVQNFLDGRCTHSFPSVKKTQQTKEFPLRRIVKCSKCHVGFTAGWSKGRTKRYPYYRCAGECTASVSAEKLDQAMIEVLRKITPKPECLDLFTKYVQEAYEQRVKNLKHSRRVADQEIEKLTTLRKVLVEKNLLGIYTDEIFKEQLGELEKKMTKAQIAKSDETLEKYDIHRLIAFMKHTLSDLGETYKRSSPTQIKALIGSIFPNGLSWDYSGTLNYEVSPFFQSILRFNGQGVPLGVVYGS